MSDEYGQACASIKNTPGGVPGTKQGRFLVIPEIKRGTGGILPGTPVPVLDQ